MYISGKYPGVVTLPPFLSLTFQEENEGKKKGPGDHAGILCTKLH